VHSEANEEGLRVRATAEMLYAQLMQYQQELVSRGTLELLQSSVALPCDPNASAQDVLLREALYNALGVCVCVWVGGWVGPCIYIYTHTHTPMKRTGLCAYELQDVVNLKIYY